MNASIIQRATFYLLGLGAVATVVPISAGILDSPAGAAGLGLAIPLIVWNLMPYAALTAAARRMSESARQAIGVLCGAAGTAAAGAAITIDSLSRGEPPWGATQIFLPVLLGIGCGITFFIGGMLQPRDD